MGNSTTKVVHYVQGLFLELLSKSRTTNLKSRFIRGVAGTFGLNIAFAGFSFISSLLVSRWLGTIGYGTYVYITAWLNVLVIPAVMGLDHLVVREIAKYQTLGAWGMAHGLLRRSNQLALLTSVGLCAVAAAVGWVTDVPFLFALCIGLILLPLMALTRVRQGAMRGLHHFVEGQVAETIVRPIVFILLLIGTNLLVTHRLTPTWILAMDVAAAGCAFIVGTRLLYRVLPQTMASVEPEYHTRTWLRDAFPLFVMNGVGVINLYVSTLMLGSLKGNEAVALFYVASRGAWFVAFFQLAVNSVLAPTAASFFASGDVIRLQRAVTKITRGGFLGSSLVGISLLIFGSSFLRLFGPDFTQGNTTLIILILGQLMNTGTGSVGILLNMAGYARDTAIAIGIGAMLNIVLNALFIPVWGAEGAAIATACTTGLWNIGLAVWAYRRLGIDSTVLGYTRHKE